MAEHLSYPAGETEALMDLAVVPGRGLTAKLEQRGSNA